MWKRRTTVRRTDSGNPQAMTDQRSRRLTIAVWLVAMVLIALAAAGANAAMLLALVILGADGQRRRQRRNATAAPSPDDVPPSHIPGSV